MPTQVEESFLFTNKPSGISTHRPSDNHIGFVEWLQLNQAVDLKICHRLDKGTSGAMVFAKNKEAAAKLTDLFADRQVKKEYCFISAKKSEFAEWYVAEDKAKGTLVKECPWQGVREGDHFLSLTKFQRISAEGHFHLYKAWPLTGKTHQIRKHATHGGTPLLGDEEYGGEAFPRLMLHCRSLEWQWEGQRVSHQCALPLLFQRMDLLTDTTLCRWITAIERRKTLFPEMLEQNQSLRLMHTETGDLRGDWVSDRAILGWWNSEAPTDSEKKSIAQLMKLFGFQKWAFQWRPGAQDKNSTALLLQSSEAALADWDFEENSVKYRGSLERGQNFGLFLDQRDRRRWVRANSQGKTVLNLFAFTCGFSLNAALGGAQKVVSVDLFAKYLDWGKENFQLNDLNPNDPSYEWRKMDALDYLSWAQKKGLQFDIVVCDPPSFSRNKKSKKVFRVEREGRGIIKQCVKILKPGGTLLFSTNFEKWELAKWRDQIEEWLQDEGDFSIQVSESQWDYEWQKFDANLKAFFVSKA